MVSARNESAEIFILVMNIIICFFLSRKRKTNKHILNLWPKENLFWHKSIQFKFFIQRDCHHVDDSLQTLSGEPKTLISLQTHAVSEPCGDHAAHVYDSSSERWHWRRAENRAQAGRWHRKETYEWFLRNRRQSHKFVRCLFIYSSASLSVQMSGV